MLEKTEDAVMNWQSIRVHKTQDEDKNKQTNKNTTHKAKKMSQDLDVLIDCRFICFWFSLYIFEMLYVFWLIDWLIVVSRQVSVILALFMTCTSLQECGTRIDRCVYYHHRPLLKTDYRRPYLARSIAFSTIKMFSEWICHLKYREVLPKGRYPRREENRL